MLYRQSRSRHHYKNGPFSIVPNLPGYAIPDRRDHGYGALARFDDTTLEPGGFVPMHEHRKDHYLHCGRPRATCRQLRGEARC